MKSGLPGSLARLGGKAGMSVAIALGLLDLGLQRRRDHLPSTLPGEVIQRDRRLLGAVSVDPANISHGVPSFPPCGGRS
jgi:hypothetical protein